MPKPVRGAMLEIVCLCGCNRTRQVRAADVARGWGKFYDKSCKAKWQAQQKKQRRRIEIVTREREHWIPLTNNEKSA